MLRRATQGNYNRVKDLTQFIEIQDTTAPNINLNAICWSEEKEIFVAVGENRTTGGNNCAVSSDGVIWTEGYIGQDGNWCSIVYANTLGLFVAISRTGTNRVATSTDGLNWTLRSQSFNGNFNDISWSEPLGRLVVIRDGTSSSNVRGMTSTDGINWTNIIFETAYNTTTVDWNSNLSCFLVGSSSSNSHSRSTDGINWTNTILPYTESNVDVIFSNPELDYFIISTSNNEDGSFYIYDGINYTSANFVGKVNSFAYSPINKQTVGFANSGERLFVIDKTGLNVEIFQENLSVSPIYTTVGQFKSSSYSLKLNRFVLVANNIMLVNNI